MIELLVVVAIITILMALLIPAVNSARVTAKTTQCAHRMGELGKAMIAYDAAKQHLPGYANTVNGCTVSWAVCLLPYIGRNDIWEGGGTSTYDLGWRGGTATTSHGIALSRPYISTYVCPSDSPTTTSPLSFAVCLGTVSSISDSSAIATATCGSASNGLFRNITSTAGSATKNVSITDVKSRSQHPMIVENACMVVADGNSAERQWDIYNSNYLEPQVFGFWWPPVYKRNRLVVASPNISTSQSYNINGVLRWYNGAYGDPNATSSDTNNSFGFFPYIHPNRINITFCDGSVRTIYETDPDDPNGGAMQCNKLDCSVIQ